MSQFVKGKIPDRPPGNKSEAGALVIIGVFFAGMMGAALFEDFSLYKLSVPIFLVSWVVLLVIHEFGHALMARALGWHVEMVSIGSGSRLARVRIFGMVTEFRAIPLSGFAVPRATDLIHPRLKNFLIFAAGPGVELLLVLIFWILLGHDTLFSRQPVLWLVGAQAFCAAAAFGALVNLVPLPHQTDSGTAWSDGLGMILSWKLPDEYFLRQMQIKEITKQGREGN